MAHQPQPEVTATQIPPIQAQQSTPNPDEETKTEPNEIDTIQS